MSIKLSRLALGLCALFALLTLAACQENPAATAKPVAEAEATKPVVTLAVVNQERIYRESDAAVEAVAYLDAISEAMRQKIADAQTDIQSQKDEEAARTAYEKILGELQQEFTAEQQNVTVKVNDLFELALDACRKEAGALVVLSSDLVLAHDASVDLTDVVLEKMNKTKIEYTKLQPDPIQENTLPASNSTETMPATNGTETSTNGTTAE